MSRWRRLAGWAIEFVVVLVILTVSLIVGSALYGDGLFLGFFLALTSIWLYFAGLESSETRATVSGRCSARASPASRASPSRSAVRPRATSRCTRAR